MTVGYSIVSGVRAQDAGALRSRFEITDRGRAALVFDQMWRVAIGSIVAGVLIWAIAMGLLLLGGRV